MRYFMYTYLLIFFISIAVNSILWIRAKANILLLFYEIVAAFYLIALTFIYFTPDLLTDINIWFCLPVIIFVIVDIYLTVWGKDEWICPPAFKYNANDLELARIAAVIFVAPAYISGIMLFLQTLLKI
jgi:hypothetical protein